MIRGMPNTGSVINSVMKFAFKSGGETRLNGSDPSMMKSMLNKKIINTQKAPQTHMLLTIKIKNFRQLEIKDE